ncbi:ABC transporter permease [Gordonia sp. CPCC 205333]|uniref:ABC transporter permease n=1 Tax=Gordonia sp. CPCC 205333 TaxID=3140790 RepID=UPI003AF3B369
MITPARELRISTLEQWRALSWRGITSIIKNGEFIFAIVSPLFLAVCFYLPLRSIMETRGIDYAQYLMPVIVLQSIAFTASAAAMRASIDGQKGINTRFRVLPMNATVPTFARLTTNTALLTVSVVFASIICLVIGWRPQGGIVGIVGLYGVAIGVGVIVSLLCDGIGLLSGSPEATSQALALPLLILGMCSTGFVTEDQFPDWIQPFARNQPVSQITNAMRAFDEGDITWYNVGPTVWWCIGLSIFAVIVVVLGNRRVRR